MIFAKDQNICQWKVHLVNQFLERLIGKSKYRCGELAKNNGFSYLGKWDNKVGFAKESDSKELILSLLFEDEGCSFYQLIIKQEGDPWLNSRVIDYQHVRDVGIV